ncbi:unannotated protein [freshwater metagenome]|uniref:Unannotated protein n=1 Tax=freshwater metagenome TaxID=449393 RepID=A0A6J7EZP7_9ZZZZ
MIFDLTTGFSIKDRARHAAAALISSESPLGRVKFLSRESFASHAKVEKSSILIVGVVVAEVGVVGGSGFRTGFVTLTILHIFFFPEETHWYLTLFEIVVVPTLEHLLPALTAARADGECWRERATTVKQRAAFDFRPFFRLMTQYLIRVSNSGSVII